MSALRDWFKEGVTEGFIPFLLMITSPFTGLLCIFWFKVTAEGTPIGYRTFGFSLWYHLLSILIITEIIFLILIFTDKKEGYTSWVEYSLWNKSMALLGALLLYWIGVPTGYFIYQAFTPIITFVLIGAGIVLFFLLNILIAKAFGRREKEGKRR